MTASNLLLTARLRRHHLPVVASAHCSAAAKLAIESTCCCREGPAPATAPADAPDHSRGAVTAPATHRVPSGEVQHHWKQQCHCVFRDGTQQCQCVSSRQQANPAHQPQRAPRVAGVCVLPSMLTTSQLQAGEGADTHAEPATSERTCTAQRTARSLTKDAHTPWSRVWATGPSHMVLCWAQESTQGDE